MRKFLQGVVVGLNWREWELLGKCPCGHCDYWQFRYRGKIKHTKESTYDKVRWMQKMYG